MKGMLLIFLLIAPPAAWAGQTDLETVLDWMTGCASSLRGAAYASSKVMISADGIESWDQDFDANEFQVWGAEKGGYIFKRE